MSLDITTSSPDETLALGRKFAALLTVGDIVLLSGRLGSGKTLFVAGVGEGLGIPDRITSPSFVISRIYRDGFLPMVHADVYRLGSIAEFEDLELTDDSGDGVLFIEWGETVAESIGDDRLDIHIDIEGTDRRFRFEPSGAWYDRDLAVLG